MGGVGTGATVNKNKPLPVREWSFIDTGNSSVTPLLADAEFTGETFEILQFGVLTICVFSDQESAEDGLHLEQSVDGVNWDHCDNFTIAAATGKTFSIQPTAMYFRVRYINGSTDQAVFRMQVIAHPDYVKPSSHRLADSISDQDDAELVKAVLSGETPGGTFINFSATNGGNLKISLEEIEDQVSVNGNSQLKVTLYHEDGTEGNLISGVNYVPGKNGIDASTESIQVMQYEHHEIHSKAHFNYCDYILNQPASFVRDFVMTAPDTLQEPHLTFSIYASEGATLELYEGCTGITGGTAIAPRNNNRRLPLGVSNVTLLQDPTIANDGLRAAGFLAGGGKTAGFTTRDKENILGQATSYLVRISSLAVSNDISWCAEWYEHTPKN